MSAIGELDSVTNLGLSYRTDSRNYARDGSSL